MTTIKPIETRYAGFRFRSRLEARWAVFFDKLGVQWEYERQGYVLDGTPYLPDFWLTQYEMWAEVKHGDVDDFDGPHVRLCQKLATSTGFPVVLLTGVPSARLYNLHLPGLPADYRGVAFFRDYDPRIEQADDYWLQAAVIDPETGRMHFPQDDRRLCKSFGHGLVEAISAARMARFEHGERP